MRFYCAIINWNFIWNTYIHKWSLQPLSQDYCLVSHTTYVVCVNFIPEWRDLQFKVDSERQIFEKLFHGRFYFTLRVFARNLLRGNRNREERYSFRISFWCLAWDLNPGFSSNKATYYLLDHGDFCKKSVEKKSPKYEILFVFSFDVWPGTRILAFHVISHHTIY